MSDTNGRGESRLDRIEETLDRVSASHVKLMTDHELFVKEHEKWAARQDAEWELQKERWKQHEIERMEWRAADAALAARIADLVSGMGAFIRDLRRGDPAK